MAAKSKIEWTATRNPDGTVVEGSTWNPIRATVRRHFCVKISPGCHRCYAGRYNERFAGRDYPDAATIDLRPERRGMPLVLDRVGVEVDQVRLDNAVLLEPLRWQRPRNIFVGSMTDLAGEWVPFAWLDAIWAVMALTPRHTYEVLTKRPARLLQWFESEPYCRILDEANRLRALRPELSRVAVDDPVRLPYPHVRIGVTVEEDRYAVRANHYLPRIPARTRWVSAEPLLGPLPSLVLSETCRTCLGKGHRWHDLSAGLDSTASGYTQTCGDCGGRGWVRTVDWLVTGGESGPGARPVHPDWVRDLRDRCRAAGVAYFHKQWGEWLPEDQRVLVAGQDVTDALLSTTRVTHRFEDGLRVYRVGKKTAGRTLDGRTWDEHPVEVG